MDPARDQGCRDLVPNGVAGYCLCGMGRRVYRSSCDAEAHAREPLVCSEACAQPESLYEILGLKSEAASDQEVKKAFRELSRGLHPDKVNQRFGPSGAQEANERFKEVRYAYDILLDPSSRMAYDAGGHSLLAKLDKDKKLPRTANTDASTKVTLETLYHGANMSVTIDKRVVCRGCNDQSRLQQPTRCSACPGRCPDETVVVKARLGPFMVDQKQRQRSKERCRVDRVHLDFTIAPGSRDGDVIRFEGAAPQLPNKLHGDVVLTLVQEPHERFARVDDDLHTTVTIPLRDALIGFRTYISHLGGHHVDLIVEPGDIVTPGMVVRIPGEGMPRTSDPSQRGDLHVQYSISFPRSLDASTRAMVEAHFPSFV